MSTVPPERVLGSSARRAGRVGLVGPRSRSTGIVDLVRTLLDGAARGGHSACALTASGPAELVSLLPAPAEGPDHRADGASERLAQSPRSPHHLASLLRVRSWRAKRGSAAQAVPDGGPPGRRRKIGRAGPAGDEIRASCPLVRMRALRGEAQHAMDARRSRGSGGGSEARLLRARLRGRAEIRPPAPAGPGEYMLAQGGPEAGLAAEQAWRRAAASASWKRAFAEHEVRPVAAARPPDGRLRAPPRAPPPPPPGGVPVLGRAGPSHGLTTSRRLSMDGPRCDRLPRPLLRRGRVFGTFLRFYREGAARPRHGSVGLRGLPTGRGSSSVTRSSRGRERGGRFPLTTDQRLTCGSTPPERVRVGRRGGALPGRHFGAQCSGPDREELHPLLARVCRDRFGWTLSAGELVDWAR